MWLSKCKSGASRRITGTTSCDSRCTSGASRHITGTTSCDLASVHLVFAGTLLALRHETQQATTKSPEPNMLCHIHGYGFLLKERPQCIQCSAIHFRPVPWAVSPTTLLPLSFVTTELVSNPQIFASFIPSNCLLYFLCPNTLRTGDANLRFYITTAQDGWRKSAFLTLACFLCTIHLTFRHRASCILGQAFNYSPENAFYIFNQQIYFIIWYLLDRASLI